MSSWRAANATVCSPAMLENEAIGADKNPAGVSRGC